MQVGLQPEPDSEQSRAESDSLSLPVRLGASESSEDNARQGRELRNTLKHSLRPASLSESSKITASGPSVLPVATCFASELLVVD